MNVLELFCGTKSVGKCCEELGWNVVSLDWESKFNPTHNCDILEFDYKQYPKDYFDIIWASPDCRFYSKLQNTWIGRRKKDGIMTTRETIEENRKNSDKLIYKCWEIIDYFNPHYWFLENPLSTLKDREVMKDKPYYIVDYCKYCDWGYRKRTCIWTNKKDFKPLICNKDCENMIYIDNQKLHSERMGTSKTIEDNGKIIRVNTAELRKKYKDYPNIQNKHKIDLSIDSIKKYNKKHNIDVSKSIGGGTNREERYRIPPNLIYSLLLD